MTFNQVVRGSNPRTLIEYESVDGESPDFFCSFSGKEKKPHPPEDRKDKTFMRMTGLEPARRGHQILSLARLPIPPHPQNVLS